ncbi:MAG: hypothetical protein M1837_000121 [Sclerophora amabilis]|nr:MAG: hypothetical protein M1837_000121 [Sclerophora amabilis]
MAAIYASEQEEEMFRSDSDEKGVGTINGQRGGNDAMTKERQAMARRILLKTDFRVLPILALLFLCSFLDRTNVGNAKILGLETDLGLNDHQYHNGLTVFYATYIASELPSNLVLKKVSPRIWLPAITVAWGIVAMCLGFVQNYAGFVIVRAFLGATEGGLLPGIVLYLSNMYTRGEMALRIGLFYTTASLSGAFGGLLARGLSAIGTRGNLTGWRWIFTVVAGIIAYLLLPNGVDTASYLSPEERLHAAQRLVDDKPAKDLDENGAVRKESFQWSEVWRGILSLQTWLSASAYFGILSGLYSFGLFIPTIIQGMGYTANEAQLWSVIPYAVAAVLTVVVSIISDRLRLRGTIMLFTLLPAIIGYAVIANISSSQVKYGMTFIMATGLYSGVPCILVWISNNSAGHYKRATTTALQLAIANCGGFVATFIYPDAEGPQFYRGHSVVLGLIVFAWFMVLFNVLYCAKINRDKAKGLYNRYAGYGDDRDPDFKMVL